MYLNIKLRFYGKHYSQEMEVLNDPHCGNDGPIDVSSDEVMRQLSDLSEAAKHIKPIIEDYCEKRKIHLSKSDNTRLKSSKMM